MKVRIAEVGIDPGGSLYVKPDGEAFPMVYRAAMQVGWDAQNERLFSPKPIEWTYRQWFNQIASAVFDEYGVKLCLASDTVWTDVPDTLWEEIRTGGYR